MPVAFHLLDLAGSAVHFYSLSIAVVRLAAHDPLGALGITAVGFICVILLAVSVIVTEVAKLKVRQYVRKRELDEQQKPRNLEDKDP